MSYDQVPLCMYSFYARHNPRHNQNGHSSITIAVVQVHCLVDLKGGLIYVGEF